MGDQLMIREERGHIFTRQAYTYKCMHVAS